MKESFYNLYAPIKDKQLCYNSLRGLYTVISNEDYQKLKDNLSELPPSELEHLFKHGFIIDDNFDELAYLENKYDDNVESSVLDLTILPTLDCNLRCWYCFEKHIKGSRLSIAVQQRIFDYVKKELDSDKITEIQVCSFGGEPLLYFKEELYPLLEKIQEYALSIGKKSSFSFITNGICITKESIELFKKLNASFQISIDGYREKHNKVKKTKTIHNAYDLVIEALYNLRDSYNPHINLRINYDNETLLHIENVVKDIIGLDREKVMIHLERVWQTSKDKRSEQVKNAITLFLINGFRVTYLNLSRIADSCKASKKNQIVISYDASVYKCTGRDFDENHREGILLDDGSVIWNKEKLEKRLSIRTYVNPLCLNCKLLPICWGPCCQKQMEGLAIKDTCQLNILELSLEEYLLLRFNSDILDDRLEKQKNDKDHE